LAVLICLLPLRALGTNPPNAAPPGVERLMQEFNEEVWHARQWRQRHNDVTRMVEILNAMKTVDRVTLDRSFDRALKLTFPQSRRLSDLEPAALRKLERFFEYYQLNGKIAVMVFSLGYPMAFNTGQIVGISSQLVSSWPEDEMIGIVAHEIGHVIAQVQERLSEEVAPETRAYQRSEEIKADWVAMMMFSSAGLDPRYVIRGMQRIVPRGQQRQAGPLHPPMAVRLVLMHEWLELPRQRPRLREALLELSAGKEVAAQP
jgi:hypothetical protein